MNRKVNLLAARNELAAAAPGRPTFGDAPTFGPAIMRPCVPLTP